MLALPGFAGTVLAAPSGAIYLSVAEGELIWICPEKLPLHRRCIQMPLMPKVLVGEKCFWQFPCLNFSHGSFIDLSRASEWAPLESTPRKLVSLTELWARYRHLLGMLELMDVSEGMGRAISLNCALAEGSIPPQFSPESFMGRVQGLVLGLAHACLDQDFPCITRIGGKIIGLGPGLTPSGDDFLGGVLFAVRSLHQTFQKDFIWDKNTVDELLVCARTRTHPISHAILSDLALGHGPEPLHQLVGGLLEGKDSDAVMEAALRVAAIGHYSGWDMLAGIMTGLLIVKKKALEQGEG